MAVEEVCLRFNDLRSDLVLMYDLRTVLLNYVFELQTLKHQAESLMPNKVQYVKVVWSGCCPVIMTFITNLWMVAAWDVTQLEVSVVKMIIIMKYLNILYYNIPMISL